MIYEVLLDGKTLYFPNDKEAVIYDATLTQALNDAGTFEFTVPCTNPLYSKIENRVSMVQVLKDGNEIFNGRRIKWWRTCRHRYGIEKSQCERADYSY